jgi:Fe-S-cluster containining protein
MASPSAPFRCTGCGDCCRGFAREKPDWEPQSGPVFRLSDEPGLPLMSWEWQRFRALAEERRIDLDVQPFDGVADEQGRRVVVLSYRLGGTECAFFEPRPDIAPGPRSEAWGFGRGGICSIYEHRPLACRAYPLVPLKGGVALSLHCPELVDADLGDAAEMLRVYGDSLTDAQAFRAAPQLAVRVLQQLEARGKVRVAPEARALAEEARATWPRVDLCDLAAEHGLAAWPLLERRARSVGP